MSTMRDAMQIDTAEMMAGEPEVDYCEVCKSEIETVDGYTSCQCPDSGYNTSGNYCARCNQRALDCGCEKGFAHDERDLP